MNIKYILSSLFILTSSHVFAEILPSHGYIDSPPSRAFFCSEPGGFVNKKCGEATYLYHGIEGFKGFPERGPADGKIASGGNSGFNALNEQTPTRWHQYPMSSGKNTFSWSLTAQHKTTSWRFFITKQNWDPNKPLERADFDLTPFCEQYDEGRIPAKNVTIECDVPDRTGYQVILGVWDIFDTGNAFYQVIDADMTSANGNNNQDKQFIADARLSTSARDNGDNFSYVLEVKSNTSPSSEPEYTWILPKNARQITVSKGYARFTIYKTDAEQKDNVTVNVTAGTESRVFEYNIRVPALTGNDKQFIAETRLSTSARDNGDNFSYVLEVKSASSPSSEPKYSWRLPENARKVTVSGGYTRFTIYKTETEQKDKASVKVTAGTESTILEYSILVPALTQGQKYDYIFPDNVENYTAGTIVLQPKDNRLYQCRPFPNGDYCQQWSVNANQYEPGVGSDWELAWILLN